MATVRELVAAYFTAEDRFEDAKRMVTRLQDKRAELATQLTAAQAERDAAQADMVTARQALKGAL